MLLKFSDDEPFATGTAPYRYVSVKEEDYPRIIIQVQVNGEVLEAIFDTGGGYFFCKPEVVSKFDLNPSDGIGPIWTRLKGVRIEGTLHRVEMVLLDDTSNHLVQEVTAFIPTYPQLYENDVFPYSYLGMLSCMERIRFAIDPAEDRFYFGGQ